MFSFLIGLVVGGSAGALLMGILIGGKRSGADADVERMVALRLHEIHVWTPDGMMSIPDYADKLIEKSN